MSNHTENIACAMNRKIKLDPVYRVTVGATGEVLNIPHCRFRGARTAEKELDGDVVGVLFTFEKYDDAARRHVPVTVRIQETMEQLQAQCKGTSLDVAPAMKSPGRQFSRGIKRADLGIDAPW